MKTTVEISDPPLKEARKIIARENTTLQALVEQGLRHVVASRKEPPFRLLRKASVRGKGLQPDLADAGWDKIRDLIYEGRGS
jgi:hypothetical protein